MKVYVILIGDSNNYRIEAVCSSLEKATQLMDALGDPEAYIEPFDVDNFLPVIKKASGSNYGASFLRC